MKRIIVIGLTLMVPLAAAAATVADIIGRARSVVNTIIPLLASVAFAASLYGIVRFIASAGSEEKRSEAKKYVLYGLVGMFIIVAFWGILTVVANTFFGGSIGAPISISGIVPSNPSPSPSPTPNPNPFPIPPPSPTPNPNPTPNPTPTPCTPATCSSLSKQCGIWSDNCDSEISCGDCDYPQICDSQGQCAGGVAPTPTPPTPVNGIVLDWNVNHVWIQFQPNETKTFIARVPQNARVIVVSFQTMGVSVTGSFKFPLKPDGTPYRTTNGITEYGPFAVNNEGSAQFAIGTGGSPILDPHIYPGDFILTLTDDGGGGWGMMATSIYY